MAGEKSHSGWYHPHALPHYDSAETIQFVTFRLADSLPAKAVCRRDEERADFKEVERELDKGMGDCWLARPEIADLVEDALLAFDGERYRLWAWCIMPNHVHCLFDVIQGNRLSDVVRAWKGFTALHANRIIKRRGSFWQRDYFDRFMRSEDQMARTIDYIERNPVQAGLCAEPAAWRWSSARRKPGVPVS